MHLEFGEFLEHVLSLTKHAQVLKNLDKERAFYVYLLFISH